MQPMRARHLMRCWKSNEWKQPEHVCARLSERLASRPLPLSPAFSLLPIRFRPLPIPHNTCSKSSWMNYLLAMDILAPEKTNMEQPYGSLVASQLQACSYQHAKGTRFTETIFCSTTIFRKHGSGSISLERSVCVSCLGKNRKRRNVYTHRKKSKVLFILSNNSH